VERMLQYARFRGAGGSCRARTRRAGRAVPRAPLPGRCAARRSSGQAYDPACSGGAVAGCCARRRRSTHHMAPRGSSLAERRWPPAQPAAPRLLLLRRGRQDADRVTVCVTVFALLELYKRGEARWEQDEPFGPITVRADTAAAASAAGWPRHEARREPRARSSSPPSRPRSRSSPTPCRPARKAVRKRRRASNGWKAAASSCQARGRTGTRPRTPDAEEAARRLARPSAHAVADPRAGPRRLSIVAYSIGPPAPEVRASAASPPSRHRRAGRPRLIEERASPSSARCCTRTTPCSSSSSASARSTSCRTRPVGPVAGRAGGAPRPPAAGRRGAERRRRQRLPSRSGWTGTDGRSSAAVRRARPRSRMRAMTRRPTSNARPLVVFRGVVGGQRGGGDREGVEHGRRRPRRTSAGPGPPGRPVLVRPARRGLSRTSRSTWR
jgi:hypothetical protein